MLALCFAILCPLLSFSAGKAYAIQCVPYARQLSDFNIYGNAWTWWKKAALQGYRRGVSPAIGSVIVFKRTSRMIYGHVGVVSKIVNSRQIIMDHANWSFPEMPDGRVPVIDVSKKNDWSKVRVWYKRTRSYGSSVYNLYGFIYSKSYVSQAMLQRKQTNTLNTKLAKSFVKSNTAKPIASPIGFVAKRYDGFRETSKIIQASMIITEINNNIQLAVAALQATEQSAVSSLPLQVAENQFEQDQAVQDQVCVVDGETLVCQPLDTQVVQPMVVQNQLPPSEAAAPIIEPIVEAAVPEMMQNMQPAMLVELESTPTNYSLLFASVQQAADLRLAFKVLNNVAKKPVNLVNLVNL